MLFFIVIILVQKIGEYVHTKTTNVTKQQRQLHNHNILWDLFNNTTCTTNSDEHNK